MSETATALRPEDTMVRTAETSIAAPTEAPNNPEQDSWATSGTQALLLLGRREIGDGLSKKDKKRLQEMATKGGAVPSTELADAAAAHICSNYWKGKSEGEAQDEWSESLDKFLGKQEGASKEFFERMGISLKDGGAETIKNKFLMDESGEHFRKDSIGHFARTIVDNNNHDEIVANMDNIKELAKLYGDEPEAIESVLQHIRGLDNLRSDPDKFAESAGLEMGMGDDDMAGAQTLEWIRFHAEEWEKEKGTKVQELREGYTLGEAIKAAMGSSVDTKKRNLVHSKIAEAEARGEKPQLDPDDDEVLAKDAGEIRIADIPLKNEDGTPMSQVEIFSKILDQLSKDSRVSEISHKIEAWISHEKRHFDVANEHFNNASLMITLSKGADGTFDVHPETDFDSSDFKNKSLSDDEKKRLRSKVIKAPGLGKDDDDIAGMSKRDLFYLELYDYAKKDGNFLLDDDRKLVMEPTNEVKLAREYIYDTANQETVNRYINEHYDNLTEKEKAQKKRDLGIDIALKRQKHPEWEINLDTLYQQ